MDRKIKEKLHRFLATGELTFERIAITKDQVDKYAELKRRKYPESIALAMKLLQNNTARRFMMEENNVPYDVATKLTDRRKGHEPTDAYIEQHLDAICQIELDALKLEDLESLTLHAVNKYWDQRIYDDMLADHHAQDPKFRRLVKDKIRDLNEELNGGGDNIC